MKHTKEEIERWARKKKKETTAKRQIRYNELIRRRNKTPEEYEEIHFYENYNMVRKQGRGYKKRKKIETQIELKKEKQKITGEEK